LIGSLEAGANHPRTENLLVLKKCMEGEASGARNRLGHEEDAEGGGISITTNYENVGVEVEKASRKDYREEGVSVRSESCFGFGSATAGVEKLTAI